MNVKYDIFMRRRRLSNWRSEALSKLWKWISINAAIGPTSVRGKRFGSFGEGSIILFPTTTIFNENYIHIGVNTMIGEHVALSAGMMPGQNV